MNLTPRLTEHVFHYTSADVGVYSILAERRFRLGPYESTNDPEESRTKHPSLLMYDEDLEAPEANTDDILSGADWWMRRYVKVGCFTLDYELPDEAPDRYAFRGWNHPPLWAHYGAGHSGVSLRFDRIRLATAFRKLVRDQVRGYDRAVEYPADRVWTLPPDEFDLSQIRHFGIDAFVTRYIDKFHRELFFTKHRDWSYETEYRLVLNDASLLPAYIDVQDSLTGVFLGENFPAARLDVVQELRSGTSGVDLFQMHSRDGHLFAYPHDPVSQKPVVRARHSGDLRERLDDLTRAEVRHEELRIRGEGLCAASCEAIKTTILEVESQMSRWKEVSCRTFAQARAIPRGDRRRAPGVPGEVVAYECGWMCVGTRVDAARATLVGAFDVQLLELEGVRLHAVIWFEMPNDEGGNAIREVWRVREECSLSDVDTHIERIRLAFGDELPAARAIFRDAWAALGADRQEPAERSS